MLTCLLRLRRCKKGLKSNTFGYDFGNTPPCIKENVPILVIYIKYVFLQIVLSQVSQVRSIKIRKLEKRNKKLISNIRFNRIKNI